MRLWSVLIRADAAGDGDGDAELRAALGEARLVKEGFSWPALLFGPLWLLWHRLWRWLAAWLAVTAIIAVLPAEAGGWLSLAVAVLLGLEGNDLLRNGLARRGWREIGLIAAEDRDAAELRLARMASGEAPLRPMRKTARHDEAAPDAPAAPAMNGGGAG